MDVSAPGSSLGLPPPGEPMPADADLYDEARRKFT